MKRVLYILPFLFFACKKDHDNSKPNPWLPANESSLMGAWKLVTNGASAGGPIIWTPASINLLYRFYSAKVFVGDSTKLDRYTITTDYPRPLSDTTLKIYKEGTTDSAYYYIRITADTLYLNSVGCIEGCTNKFTRGAILSD